MIPAIPCDLTDQSVEAHVQRIAGRGKEVKIALIRGEGKENLGAIRAVFERLISHPSLSSIDLDVSRVPDSLFEDFYNVYVRSRSSIDVKVHRIFKEFHFTKYGLKIQDNEFKDKDLQSFCESEHAGRSWDEFSFESSELTDIGLAALLNWSVRHNKPIRALTLEEGKWGKNSAELLAKYLGGDGCKLHVLRLSKGTWGETEHTRFRIALGKSKSLVEFFYDGTIPDSEFSQYGTSLRDNCNLTTLSFSPHNLILDKKIVEGFMVNLGRPQPQGKKSARKEIGALISLTEKKISSPVHWLRGPDQRTARLRAAILGKDSKELEAIYRTKFSPYAPLDEKGNIALHMMVEEGWSEGIRWFNVRFPDFDKGYRNLSGEAPKIVEDPKPEKRERPQERSVAGESSRVKRPRPSTPPSEEPEEEEDSQSDPHAQLQVGVEQLRPEWVLRHLYHPIVTRDEARRGILSLDQKYPESKIPAVKATRALLVVREGLDDVEDVLPIWSKNLDLIYTGKTQKKTVSLPGIERHSGLRASLPRSEQYFQGEGKSKDGNPVVAGFTFVHSKKGGRDSYFVRIGLQEGSNFHLRSSETIGEFDLRRDAITERVARGEEIASRHSLRIEGGAESSTVQGVREQNWYFTAKFHHGEQSLLTALSGKECIDFVLESFPRPSEETRVKVYAAVLEIFSPLYACPNCLRSLLGEVFTPDSPFRRELRRGLREKKFRLPKGGEIKFAIRISSEEPYMRNVQENHPSVLIDVNQPQPLILQHDLRSGQEPGFQFDSRAKRGH